MPTPQDLLNSIVNQKLGVPPQAAAAPGAAPGVDPAAAMAAMAAAQGGGAPAAPQAPPKASDTPTNQEKGAAKVAPTEAGSEPSYNFVEIDDGDGGKRQLTTDQIKGTMDRYSALNHRWQSEVAPMKPVLEVAKQLMAAAKANGHEPKGDDLAKLMEAAVRAYIKNPQMGGGKKGSDADGDEGKAAMSPPDGDGDDVLSAWEKENAVKLPPGYKEQGAAVKGLSSKLDQVMQLLTQAVQGGGTVQQAQQQAQQHQQAAKGAQMSAAKQAVLTNIQSAMQSKGLKPEDAADFQTFAQARGYSPEDFIDPEMTATVVNDFAANRQAPEIARLRDIAARRQAFTGAVEGAPGGAAAAPAGSADPMLAKMLGSALSQRGMG